MVWRWIWRSRTEGTETLVRWRHVWVRSRTGTGFLQTLSTPWTARTWCWHLSISGPRGSHSPLYTTASGLMPLMWKQWTSKIYFKRNTWILYLILFLHCRVCRDQFIALHSSPILEQLSQHFVDNFVNLPEQTLEKSSSQKSSKRKERLEDRNMTERTKRELLFKSVPTKGELNLDVIHDSTYFFS